MITKAMQFVEEWKNVTSEDGEGKTFWDQFFAIFGISRRKVAIFEKRVKLPSGGFGYIDLFWPGKLLVEHKSRGKDLNSALEQAFVYCEGLRDKERPEYVLVSDFSHFILVNLKTQERTEFPLQELPNNLHLFNFIHEEEEYIKQEHPVNQQAVHALGKVADGLIKIGYSRDETQILIARLIFCFFAEDTGIFAPNQFTKYIQENTREDGLDLSMHLQKIFSVLNTKERGANLHQSLSVFPYVNGGLFSDKISVPDLTQSIRASILEVGMLDWRMISPAILGSLFQGILDPKQRREFGAHFTSEDVILKTIYPLFLDELWDTYNRFQNNKTKLQQLHEKIAGLHILDPACGSGNFLIIAYRELRRLENKILEKLVDTKKLFLDIGQMIRVDISNFHGIEIEEWPAYIAKVSMWIMEHLMNMETSAKFGQHYVKIPLTSSVDIQIGDSLKLEWPKAHYIIGNPPFIGNALMKTEQKEQLQKIGAPKNTDYVSGWFIKSAKMMENNPEIECALVATSSIVQGAQALSLWKPLFDSGFEIKFAYKPFKWGNEAKKNAAVWVIIVGLGKKHFDKKYIYDSEECKEVKNINYLLQDIENVFIEKHNKPICNVEEMRIGSSLCDGGNLQFSEEEYEKIKQNNPEILKYIRRYMSGEDFLYNKNRYVLWLKDFEWDEFMQFPIIKEKVLACKEFRKQQKGVGIKKFVHTPHLFAGNRQQEDGYVLLIPRVSSEQRKYIPIEFVTSDIVFSNQCLIIPNASMYSFGILNSYIHNVWVKFTAGRLENRLLYSATICYNSFPWPDVSPEQKERIEQCAQKILDARDMHADKCLADLYGEMMPPELMHAHKKLDKVVYEAYGLSGNETDEEICKHLIQRYQNIVNKK